jgi:hypothetical protein
MLPRLTPLRVWLEAHIEAAANDAEGRLLETLPVDLAAAPDLETCCRYLMDELRQNRAYATPHLALSFRYKTARRQLAAA